MSYSNFQKTIALSVGVLSMAFLIGYIVLAWTEPGTTPPAGNVSAPINVGSVSQTKSGLLGIGDLDSNFGLTIATSTGGIKITNISTQPTQPSLYVEDESRDTTPFIIDGDGNVGIGTKTPSEKLEIVGGGIQLNENYGIGFAGESPNNGNVGTDGAKFYYDAAFFGTYLDALVIEKTDHNDSDPDGGIVFTNKGSDNTREVSMVIRGDGKVGIGTTTPSKNLDITLDSHGEGIAIHQTASNAGSYLTFYDDDGNEADIISFDSDHFRNNELAIVGRNGKDITFMTSADNAIGDYIVTMLNNGNVGIGTPEPKTKLEIGAQDEAIEGGEIRWAGAGTNRYFYIDNYKGRLRYVSQDATGESEKVTILNNGNVGIGTPEPNYKLDVNGNIGLTGTHLVFNSGHGVIDWGNGSGGNLYFRTLEIQGNITKYNNRVIIENNGNITVGNDGTGKINVGEIDPVFDIDGEKYSTYVPDIAGGLTTQTFGKANLSFNQESGKYEYIICFDALEKGSDLWLFGKTTDFGKEMENLTVLLTPEKETANLYYQLDPKENQLIIFGEKPVTFSYFLSAPRIDHKKHLDNLAEDQDLGGIKVSDYRE